MGDKLKGILEGAGGGLLGGGIAVGAYLIVSAIATGADAGAWLAFAGALIGVIGTIGVTLYLAGATDRKRSRYAITALREALGTWLETVNSFPTDHHSSTLNNLDQQLAYIGTLAPEIGRNHIKVTLALHTFNFHVSSMLKMLRVIDHPHDAKSRVTIVSAAGHMRAYAQKALDELKAA